MAPRAQSGGLVGWATSRARMVMAFVVLSLLAGVAAYSGLPKEGSPNIDVPVLYISVPLPGVSTEDAERLIVKPLETELRGIEGLKEMTGIATQGHASLLLEFDFDWDKTQTLADVRAKVDQAKSEFPSDAEEPTINEVNLSQFPILVISLSGNVPERTLLYLAKDLQRDIEGIDSVLEAALAGHREEMLEVLIDPLKLEAYGVTIAEFLAVVQNNNLLVASGSLESGSGAFPVNVTGSLETVGDVYNLPVKVNGDRVVRLGDVTDIRRTFEDHTGYARFNGTKTIALQVKKRIGENIIATVAATRETVDAAVAEWPEPLRQAVSVEYSMDMSVEVRSMVSQLEASVITAVLLVMIVVLGLLGLRSALLVGMAIPLSFLLTFALMAALGIPINNMVMFGLILAVGMLVDGAIVVVEYADKEISRGQGPMRAYAAAAKRMFWPIVSSTATTLCAFLPMLLWPGMPGEFMSQLPTTLIFVLSASLIVALIFLPVLGGTVGRIGRSLAPVAQAIRGGKPAPEPVAKPYKRSAFGKVMALVVQNPIGPFVAIGCAVMLMMSALTLFENHSEGVEFFVETEPERAIIHVRARGNLSLEAQDAIVRQAEAVILEMPEIRSVFAFTGSDGLEAQGDNAGPPDSIGQITIELAPWNERRRGKVILAELGERLGAVPGLLFEIALQEEGPQQGKPVQLELRSNNWDDLNEAAEIARAKFETTPGLIDIDDSRPLPGIEWRVTVDRATAGLFGADIASIGPIIPFVTRGSTLDTVRPPDADEEIDVRVRFPEEYRILSTLDQLRIPTARGLVPLSNFIERTPAPKLDQIVRRDTERSFLVRADVPIDGEKTDVALIGELETWIAEENPFPASVSAEFGGDREEQEESMAFLGQAMLGALGLMFIILLAQFNSLYNALLVLTAVVMSVAGVLIGMVVMGQKFSIIMTGTGIVALAGIVVNNNIVLIDTFQDYAKRMPTLEAIVRTAEDRIRPVLLTTITTMAGLTPMMFAMSLDFSSGTISEGAPTALWWVQLATAVVFGLGTATVLTLMVTPAALAARVWVARGAGWSVSKGWERVTALFLTEEQRRARVEARARRREARETRPGDLVWGDDTLLLDRPIARAAE